MKSQDQHSESRLAIEIEPELRQRIEAAAIERGVSLRDYVVAALREALAYHHPQRALRGSDDWSQLSVPSFARDWDSDADAVYDELA